LVLGVGSSWPHDFLFFTGFLSSCVDEGAGDDIQSEGAGDSSDVSASDTVDCSKKSTESMVKVVVRRGRCEKGQRYDKSVGCRRTNNS
jgi:hypothetical protein